MIIRKTMETDLKDIMRIHREAFNEEDEAELTAALLKDPSAAPVLSLIAVEDDISAGHILFTQITLTGSEKAVSGYILAPLAVVPEQQDRGVGGRLIRRGLEILSDDGVELVFVLGHPGYYPKHGFAPASRHGLDAPYPIPAKDADAWMVQELISGVIGSCTGKVRCADVMMDEQYWRE